MGVLASKYCFVLNVDESCLDDSKVGAGGLIRRGDDSFVIGLQLFSCCQ